MLFSNMKLLTEQLLLYCLALLEVCEILRLKGKGRGFPYSIPSVGPGADPGVQVVSPQLTVSHPSGGRLPLLRLPSGQIPLRCLVRSWSQTCNELKFGISSSLLAANSHAL